MDRLSPFQSKQFPYFHQSQILYKLELNFRYLGPFDRHQIFLLTVLD